MDVDDQTASATGTTDSESLDDGEFIVENVMEKRFANDGRAYYYVKWLGYGPEDNTWEPLENLSNCRDLIERFEAKQQLKAQKKRTSKKTGSEKTPQANKKEGNDSSENEPKRAIGTNWSPNFEEVAGSGVCSQEDMDTYCYGPTFRRVWRESEEPLCILGSAVREGVKLHLVRLKPSCPEELREALLDEDQGVTMSNTVVVLADDFNLRFTELVMAYYEGRVMFQDNAKTAEENTQAAARAALFHRYKENEVAVNAAPIFKDMMKDVPGFKKEEDTNEYFLNKCGDTDPYVDKTRKDAFGLPESYSSDESEADDGDGSSESSDDENGYEEIKFSLKRKRNVVKH